MEHHDLFSGLIRLHVLHHAAEGELYGAWMIEELARHGYRLSPGTLYSMLRSMEKKGYLLSEGRRVGRTSRRVYKATPLGREALDLARGKGARAARRNDRGALIARSQAGGLR